MSAARFKIAEDELFSQANSRKARLGMLAGLQDAALMAKKQAEEKALRDSVASSAELKAAYGGSWDEIESALKAWNDILVEPYLGERAGNGDREAESRRSMAGESNDIRRRFRPSHEQHRQSDEEKRPIKDFPDRRAIFQGHSTTS